MMTILLITAVAIFVIRGVRRRRRHRDLLQNLESVVETTDLLLATLRAGYSIPASLLMLADIAPHPVHYAFRTMRAAYESGSPLTSALAATRTELGTHFGALISLVFSALRLGIPTETLMMQIQSEARHVHRQFGETLARQLPVRLNLPLVLCILPSFIVLIIVPIVAGTIHQLQLQGGIP